MEVETYIPTDSLKPFIRAYRIIESRDGITNRIVPNTSVALTFRLKGQVSYSSDKMKMVLPSVALSGLRKSVRLIQYEQNTAALIVQFKEGSVSSFFKQPLHELFEQSVSLANLLPQSEISCIEERLAESEENEARIAFVEVFLLSKLTTHYPDKLVAEAINKIHSLHGNTSIKELAKQLYISQDAFEKRFRRKVGATPKQFSHIVKMNTLVRHKSGSSFLDMAYVNGYCDPAHFSKDFKVFTGQTPTDFFKSPCFW